MYDYKIVHVEYVKNLEGNDPVLFFDNKRDRDYINTIFIVITKYTILPPLRSPSSSHYIRISRVITEYSPTLSNTVMRRVLSEYDSRLD